MKLTRRKLIKGNDWKVWEKSEWNLLNQYEAQGMFVPPIRVDTAEATFNLVWMNVIKELDNHKNACCTCYGSPRSCQVCVLDYTHANCVD